MNNEYFDFVPNVSRTVKEIKLNLCSHCPSPVKCAAWGCITSPTEPPVLKRKRIYLIGSLRNAKVAELGNALRKEGYDIFDDWHAAGPEADDYWQKYEIAKGNNFRQALAGAAAQNVFNFDKRNLDASDAVVMVMPAGKSGHLELGYMAGKGNKTCIFMDGEPERFDVMYNFADYIALSKDDVIKWAKGV